jgi:8-oxo-dGTP pyrophosphatase MutT (NUDIX family)
VTENSDLAWTVHEARTVYDNRWVKVDLVDVQAPGGERFDHHVVRLDSVAIAMIVRADDSVLTSWRYRFPTDQWGYELVGGLVELGEDAADTARREAEEETGWRPLGNPEKLLTFQPLPGIVTAPIHVYLWRDAVQVGAPAAGEEVARIEWIPIARLVQYVREGQVLGAGAIVPILLYALSRPGANEG